MVKENLERRANPGMVTILSNYELQIAIDSLLNYLKDKKIKSVGTIDAQIGESLLFLLDEQTSRTELDAMREVERVVL